MALFHLSVTQTKRSAGQSAIASAAYRAGERLYSEYYGEYSDYTRKGGVICSNILLPSHAPPEYADRQTLWNAVEKAERGKNAQLAYSFDIALQNEFSLEENIALARQCQSCMQAGRSFHARLFPRRSIGSGGLRIRAVHGTAGECQSRSRRPCGCSRCIRRNTRYTIAPRLGRQQKR